MSLIQNLSSKNSLFWKIRKKIRCLQFKKTYVPVNLPDITLWEKFYKDQHVLDEIEIGEIAHNFALDLIVNF